MFNEEDSILNELKNIFKENYENFSFESIFFKNNTQENRLSDHYLSLKIMKKKKEAVKYDFENQNMKKNEIETKKIKEEEILDLFDVKTGENFNETTISCLLIGERGVGKSFLTQKISQMFYLKKFVFLEFLFYVDLKKAENFINGDQNNDQVGFNIFDYIYEENFKCFENEEEKKKKISLLKKSNKEGKILWIFDHFDQLFHQKIGQYLKKIISSQKNIFWKSIFVSNFISPQIILEFSFTLELKGFKKKSKEIFLKNYFSEIRNEKISLHLNKITENTVFIESLRNPLFLSMLSFLSLEYPDYILKKKRIKIPKIIEKVVLFFIQKINKKNKKNYDETQIFLLFSFIAFTNYKKKNYSVSIEDIKLIEKDIFKIEELDFKKIEKKKNSLLNLENFLNIFEKLEFMEKNGNSFTFKIEIIKEFMVSFFIFKTLSSENFDSKMNEWMNKKRPLFLNNCSSILPFVSYHLRNDLKNYSNFFDSFYLINGFNKNFVENLKICFEYSFSLKKEENQDQIIQIISNMISPIKLELIFHSKNVDLLSIKFMSSNCYSPDIKDENGNNSIHYILQNENVSKEIITLLLNSKININSINKLGKSYLHIATENKNIKPKILASLYSKENSSIVNSFDNFKRTPLYYASFIDNPDNFIFYLSNYFNPYVAFGNMVI